MLFVNISNITRDSFAQRSEIELKSINPFDNLVGHKMIGFGRDHTMNDVRPLDLLRFNIKLVTNYFVIH